MKRLNTILTAALLFACGHAAAQDLLWDDVQRLPAYRDRAAYLSCKVRGAVVEYESKIGVTVQCVRHTGVFTKDRLGPAVRMTLQEVVDVHWPDTPPGKVPVAVGVMPSQMGDSHGFRESREAVWVAVRYLEVGQIAELTTDKAKPKAQIKTPAALQGRDGLKK